MSVMKGQSMLYSSFFTNENGIYACGNDTYGQLGLGSIPGQTWVVHKTEIPIQAKVIQVVSRQHTLFLCKSGDVWSAGKNFQGQLGYFDEIRTAVPTKIPGLPPITAIACGDRFSLFLDHQQSVWICGQNNSHIRKYNHAQMFTKPAKLEYLPPITAITCGENFSLFLDNQGSVWHCGENIYLPSRKYKQAYKLPLGNLTIREIACGFYFSLFLDAEGSVWGWGSNYFGHTGELGKLTPLTKVEHIPVIAHIFCGMNHSMFLDENSSVWACGDNTFGQLGLGHDEQVMQAQRVTGLPAICTIACGATHSFFTDFSLNVWGCGSNYERQLGTSQSGNSWKRILTSFWECENFSVPKFRPFVVFVENNPG